jgi:glycosyltransferase involved in cell wall biosynthesis
MRIAIYTGMFKQDQDGATKTIYRLVDALLRAGNEVAVFGFSITPQRRPGLHLITLPSMPFPLYRDYRLALATPRILRILDGYGPDLIQVTVPDLAGVELAVYARRKRIPVVATYHTVFPEYFKYYHLGSLAPLGWRLARSFYSRMNTVYAPTEIAAREFRRRGLDNIKIWSRGIDLGQYRPGFRQKSYRDALAGGRPTVILYAGRFVPYKDIGVLADVYDSFHGDAERRARFVLAGSGPEEEALRRRMPEAVFAGYLHGDALARIYANSDLLLFPSPTESFGNVVLEALASGTPAVVADRGGCQEIIAQSEAGLIARSGDARDFYRKCLMLIEDRSLYDRMRRRGLEYAQGRSWDVIVGWLVKELTSQAAKKAERF